MNIIRSFIVASWILLTFSSCDMLSPESEHGTIEGKVLCTYSIFYGATITTIPASGTIGTDNNDRYVLDNVAPGEYTVYATSHIRELHGSVKVKVVTGKTTYAPDITVY